MQTATRRTVIAGAALAAAGLFGSLPYHGSTQAHGIPTVHRDVALVDVGDSILGSETSFDSMLTNDVWGSAGSEATLYQSFVTAFGAPEAQILLDTNTASPVYSGVFNGAESRLFEGAYLELLAGEDHVNQLFGVTATASETAILADLAGGPPLIDGDVLPTVGSSGFDAALTSIASDDFSYGFGDLQGYFAELASNLGSLGDGGGLLSGLIGDLGSGGLATILGDLGLGSLGSL